MKKTVTSLFVALLLVQPAGASPLLSGASGSGCSLSLTRVGTLPVVVNVPDAYTANTPDPVTDAMKAWAEAVMRLGSNAKQSADAREKLHAALMTAANSNALSWPSNWSSGRDRPPSVIYHTMETLFPAIVAYGQNRSAFTEQERDIFEIWAGSIIDRLGKTDKIRSWKTDNKKYQFGALSAAYGVITGKQKFLSSGTKIYKSAIGSMRKDGSLPGDTERGGSSLHYSNLAIANLVAIAEYASDAGLDLYAYQSGGKSIHLAIQFLAAAQNDPNLIAGYARRTDQGTGSFDGFSAEKQDRRWAQGPDVLWGYSYIKRFGKTETGQALLAASPFLKSGKGGVHQQSGGNTRCFVNG
ncbi:alginate lyase family protein [Paragemmobacter aquarius]|nr:alginate lyase family protein [Gemmobacter aquarius]